MKVKTTRVRGNPGGSWHLKPDNALAVINNNTTSERDSSFGTRYETPNLNNSRTLSSRRQTTTPVTPGVFRQKTQLNRHEQLDHIKKFTTYNEGKTTRVRGNLGGSWHLKPDNALAVINNNTTSQRDSSFGTRYETPNLNNSRTLSSRRQTTTPVTPGVFRQKTQLNRHEQLDHIKKFTTYNEGKTTRVRGNTGGSWHLKRDNALAVINNNTTSQRDSSFGTRYETPNLNNSRTLSSRRQTTTPVTPGVFRQKTQLNRHEQLDHIKKFTTYNEGKQHVYEENLGGSWHLKRDNALAVINNNTTSQRDSSFGTRYETPNLNNSRLFRPDDKTTTPVTPGVFRQKTQLNRHEQLDHIKKFTTYNEGKTTRVRGNPGGSWHLKRDNALAVINNNTTSQRDSSFGTTNLNNSRTLSSRRQTTTPVTPGVFRQRTQLNRNEEFGGTEAGVGSLQIPRAASRTYLDPNNVKYTKKSIPSTFSASTLAYADECC
ncbi:uncharacterized protein LOC135470074 [Liolophura sinensis]|uniref:uncharacterized protein LOC135470074 n=1 Tax=Liolophura sinensis TaxID=3198878 RepID=UPI0031598C7A